jgi:hypothetical protein
MTCDVLSCLKNLESRADCRINGLWGKFTPFVSSRRGQAPACDREVAIRKPRLPGQWDASSVLRASRAGTMGRFVSRSEGNCASNCLWAAATTRRGAARELPV